MNKDLHTITLYFLVILLSLYLIIDIGKEMINCENSGGVLVKKVFVGYECIKK